MRSSVDAKSARAQAKTISIAQNPNVIAISSVAQIASKATVYIAVLNVKMIIDKKYFLENRNETINAIKAGKIFIYPTDTIYGIGCNAENESAVNKIRLLKQRELKPFSIIAPSFEWIENLCRVDKKISTELKSKLPGPYTFFLNIRNDRTVSEIINPLENSTIGIRIPKHWFTEIIAEAGVPFITTSVNISGMPYMKNIEDLDETIKNDVDFIIYEGEINGRESTKIDLTKLV